MLCALKNTLYRKGALVQHVLLFIAQMRIGINTSMSKQTYLMPMAYCRATGQKVKGQDLTGHKYTSSQRKWAQEAADRIAAKQTARTEREWVGILETYTPGVNTLINTRHFKTV